MADTLTVKTVGMENAISNIRALAVASPEAVKRGTLRTALLVERQAKSNVPVDTGRLRASISTNWTGSGLSRGKVDAKAGPGDGVGQPGEKKDTFRAVVGSNVEYAAAVEFNETARHDSGGPHYLFSAYFAHEGDLDKEIAREVGKEIAKALRKRK